MRLKKCLVILPLLALTLSGCNNTKVSDSPESSSSSESEQTSGEITALSNYTLSFTFYSSGIKSSIPDYASAYIIGDWDWNTFLPLTEADGVYSYTFSSIEVGTHEYKGVMWYSDETVSWTNCVEIITQGTGNATFIVRDSDGDGYTQYIDCTLNATLEPKSTEGGEGETSSSDSSTSEDPTTGGSSSSEDPGTGGSSSSENPGTGEGSSSDGSTSSGNTGEGETNNSYAIEVADEDSLKSLEYSGTPLYINLAITLITYDENNTVVDTKTANADDVTFSGYDSSIVTFNEQGSLRGTIVGAGSTSLTITWGSYATKTIEIIVIDTTGGDEEEKEENPIISAIVSSLNSLSYLDQEWEAAHVKDTDEDGVITDYYMTSDEDYYLYGKYEAGDAYGYYTDMMLYEYDGSEYTSRTYANQYDDFLDSYSEPLDIIDELEDEYSDYAVLSTDNDGNYVLTYDLTDEDDAIYTFVSTTSYEIIQMGYVDDDDENYTVAKYTVAEVKVKMEGFNIEDWEPKITEVENYTLSFTFTLEEGGTALTVPEGGSLYITYGEEYDDYGEFLPLTPSTGNTYTYLFDRITIDWYSYDIYIGYTEDSWHTANTCYKVASGYFDVYGTEGAGYTNSIEEVVEQSFDAILPTTYTFYISIYYGDQLQSAPEGTTIYATGSWDGWSEDNPIALTEADNGTYALTLTDVKVSYYEAQLILVKDGGTLSWDYRITAEGGNVYCNVILGTASNTTTATAVNALDSIIPADARETISNYTITFTFTYGGVAATIPSYAYIYFGADCNSWNYVALTESDGVYSTTLDSVPAGENKYDLVFGYSDGPVYEYTIASGAYFTVTGLEEDECVADPIETVFPFDPATFVDPSTIETRTNFVVNYYFVDNVDNPTTYYSLPAYADAYVAGYFTAHTGSWNEPDVTSSLYKLTGNGGDSGYSVTFPTILTGTCGYNIYFLYNSSATNHNEDTSFSWSHPISSSDLSMTIPTTGSSIDVKIAANPEEIFLDNADFCTLRVAIKDTSNSGDKGVIISSDADSWGGSIKMTYNPSNTDYQYYYDYKIDKGTEYKFGIFSNSSWNDRLYPASGNSETWADGSNNIVIASSCTNYDYTLFLITADCSNFGGNTNFAWTSYSITHPTGGF